MRGVLLTAFVLVLPAFGLAQQPPDANVTAFGETRVALVVGNNQYAPRPLANPVNDAKAMQKALADLGFEVTLLTDATGVGMQRQIQAFLQGIKPDSVAVVYFAGHGVEIDGLNYLIPVDLIAEDEFDVKDKAVNVSSLLARLEESPARVRLLILDACRNNPFLYAAKRGLGERGLAAPAEVTGSFVAFSTAAGHVAHDGNPVELQGRASSPGVPGAPRKDKQVSANSVFTAALVKELGNKTPGSTLDQVFNRVRADVADATDKKQVPFSSNGLIGEWYPFGLATKPDPDTNHIKYSRMALEGAVRLMANGDFGKPQRELDDAVQLDWKNAEAYNYRGLVHAINGRHAEELSDFSEAVRLDPSNYLGYLNRALALKSGGNCLKAIEDFDMAARLAPAQPLIYRYRAACWAEVGDLRKSEDDLQKYAVLRGDRP